MNMFLQFIKCTDNFPDANGPTSVISGSPYIVLYSSYTMISISIGNCSRISISCATFILLLHLETHVTQNHKHKHRKHQQPQTPRNKSHLITKFASTVTNIESKNNNKNNHNLKLKALFRNKTKKLIGIFMIENLCSFSKDSTITKEDMSASTEYFFT